MRSSNPVFSEKHFSNSRNFDTTNVMTVDGTIMKTAIFLLITIVSAGVTWTAVKVDPVNPAFPMSTGMMSIGAFIAAMVAIFAPKTTKLTLIAFGYNNFISQIDLTYQINWQVQFH